MTWTETVDRPTEINSEQGEQTGEYSLESPFTAYFFSPAGETATAETVPEIFEVETTLAEGPFVSPFTTGSPSESGTSLRAELVAELTNPELASALGEVVQEVSAVHAEHMALTAGEAYGAAAEAAELAAAQHLEVLGELTDRYLETLAATAGERDAATLTEDELTQLLEALEQAPTPTTESPAFENFFGAIRRTVGKVLSGAANLAKRAVQAVGSVLPLGEIIRKLKALVAPLLKRVLTFAIDRLPVALRPAANRLRARLFGSEVMQEDELNPEALETVAEQAAVGDTRAMEYEFTARVADLLTETSGQGEEEDEWTQPESVTETPYEVFESGDGRWSANEIDAARIRLISELSALRDGESAAPVFENFLPAILPAVRLGITVVGRGRVVNFLAGMLAKMLNRYVGPQLSRPLSQAIVDAGLRVLTLESPTPQEVALAGPSAIAAVAEDTARALSALEAAAFEDPVRLEVETIAAFNEAVARNFPPSLLRADLPERESQDATSMWAMRPRVYWYKKYTKVFEVELTPQTAASITTFGGVTLAAFLRSVHGITKTVKTHIHLYETLPGTYLSRIAALERDVPYMKYDGWRRFHPLSVSAAGTLLSEPGLGKDVDAEYLRDRGHIASGQRFYYLTLPVTVRDGGGGPSQAFVVIDGRPTSNLIKIFLYLSEADAQPIAARARQNNTTAFVIALRAAFAAAVRSLRMSPRSRVTVLRESELTGETEVYEAGGGVAAAIGEKVLGVIIDKLIDAAIRLATDYARAKRDEFVKMVDDPKSGVTVIATIPAPGLSTVLRGGVLPSIAQVGALRTVIGSLTSSKLLPGLQTVAGFRRG
jgi:hypothetical protein